VFVRLRCGLLALSYRNWLTGGLGVLTNPANYDIMLLLCPSIPANDVVTAGCLAQGENLNSVPAAKIRTGTSPILEVRL